MSVILEILKMLVTALAPLVLEQAQDGAEIGKGADAEDKSLRRKLERDGWLLLLIAPVLLSGCFTRTVYVPPGKSVMLRQDIKHVKIWAKDKNGKRVPGRLTLKEGWFVVPMEPKEDE